MKYNKDWKVEFCWNKCGSLLRYYYWRIVPQELNLLQRIFCNRWHKMYQACLDEWNPGFDVTDYWKYIDNIKTYGDIVNFEEQEFKKIKSKREEYLKTHAVFPY